MFRTAPALFCLLFILFNHPAFSQKNYPSTGEYLMRVENNMAWNDAVKIAVTQAQVNAIENKFGRAITQDNSTYVQNSQAGENVKTNTTFNFISNSYVKGEWIEDIKEPEIRKIDTNGEQWIKVTVYGKIREITAPDNKFDAFALSCPDLKCQTRNFNDGQDFYLYFKSSEDGYVAIYCSDPSLKYTFLLLPYKRSINKKNVPVKADREYIFFSKKNDYFNDGNGIDEQTMSVGENSQAEKYQVWILFSPEPLDKPVLEDESITTKKFLDEQSIKQGYTLQKGINDEKFKEWLQGYRVYNKKVQLSSIFIDANKMK